MREIDADRLVTPAELQHICSVKPQWVRHLEAAQDYVRAYREYDLITVQRNPGLGNMAQEAERALALLAQVECGP